MGLRMFKEADQSSPLTHISPEIRDQIFRGVGRDGHGGRGLHRTSRESWIDNEQTFLTTHYCDLSIKNIDETNVAKTALQDKKVVERIRNVRIELYKLTDFSAPGNQGKDADYRLEDRDDMLAKFGGRRILRDKCTVVANGIWDLENDGLSGIKGNVQKSLARLTGFERVHFDIRYTDDPQFVDSGCIKDQEDFLQELLEPTLGPRHNLSADREPRRTYWEFRPLD